MPTWFMNAPIGEKAGAQKYIGLSTNLLLCKKTRWEQVKTDTTGLTGHQKFIQS